MKNSRNLIQWKLKFLARS